MGRHRAPSTETAVPPRAPFAIAAGAVLLVVALLVGVFVAMRGGGDDHVTARPRTAPQSSPPESIDPTVPPSSPSPSPSPSATAPATARPPTLQLTMGGKSYVTVRTAKGRTLVAKLFRKGQRKSFDQKQLRVILGNSAAVLVTINGKARKPGRRGQVETFTVRRK